MNRYHEMRKTKTATEQDHVDRNSWARAITWQMIVDNLAGRMLPETTRGCDHHTFVNPRQNAAEEEAIRERCRKTISQELGFNTRVGDHGIGVPRSGKLTIINFNDLRSAELFVYMLREELGEQAEEMKSTSWEQAHITVRQTNYWERWTKLWPMHEVSDEVKKLLKHIGIIAHFLRLFDFGYISYEHRQQGSIWADGKLCAWLDTSKLCIYMDQAMFTLCCQPEQAQYYKPEKWQKYRNTFPFVLFSGMADLRYNCLKMLQNWHDLVAHDEEVRKNWGYTQEGRLDSAQIQKDAEEKIEAEKYNFHQDWQTELKHAATERAQASNWKWGDERWEEDDSHSRAWT